MRDKIVWGFRILGGLSLIWLVKVFLGLGMMAFTVTALTGCSNAKATRSYTYEIKTGDTIKVTLETQTGFKMTKGFTTTFTKKDSDYEARGLFLDEAGYQEVYDAIYATGYSGEILETGETVEGNRYIFFAEDMSGGNKQYSFVLHVGDSDTYYMMSTLSDRDKFEENFDLLTFEED